jgi:hypothetical protein
MQIGHFFQGGGFRAIVCGNFHNNRRKKSLHTWKNADKMVCISIACPWGFLRPLGENYFNHKLQPDEVCSGYAPYRRVAERKMTGGPIEEEKGYPRVRYPCRLKTGVCISY